MKFPHGTEGKVWLLFFPCSPHLCSLTNFVFYHLSFLAEWVFYVAFFWTVNAAETLKGFLGRMKQTICEFIVRLKSIARFTSTVLLGTGVSPLAFLASGTHAHPTGGGNSFVRNEQKTPFISW